MAPDAGGFRPAEGIDNLRCPECGEEGKAVGVYGKGLGIFDDSVLSILN